MNEDDKVIYLEFFNLKEAPLILGPDPRYLYMTPQVNETLDKHFYIISRRLGPVYTSGPVGTGKTTLATRLEEKLRIESKPNSHKNKYLVKYYKVPPMLTANAFLRDIMNEFDIKTDRSYSKSLNYIADWLVKQYDNEIKPVLIIDEAQYLNAPHLKLLHFFFNYETKREKLIQIVLFGQTDLSDKVNKFPELKSRMYPAALTALNRKDTEDMLKFRWFVAGGGNTIPFSPTALDKIFEISKGLPRDVIKLADISLIRAFELQVKEVNADHVMYAATDLDLLPKK
jgi:type II secretory pathway predicted ATPase ExeA